jgi:hypothetical protein
VGGKPLQTRIRRHGSRGDPRPCGRHSTLRGLTATAGFLGRFQADSRAGSARDEEAGGRMSNTYADLQDFYGSDGTRTRDLRRDRPVFGAAGLSGDRRGFRRELVFRPAVAGIGGRGRELPATSCGMSAGWIVVASSNTAGCGRHLAVVFSGPHVGTTCRASRRRRSATFGAERRASWPVDCFFGSRLAGTRGIVYQPPRLSDAEACELARERISTS